MKLLVLAAVVSAAVAASFQEGSCSEDCIDYLLSNPAGPKVLRLYKELLKPNVGGKSPVDVNGQTYEVSYTKKNFIENAMRKGIRESVIESMLDDAAIFPQSTSDRQITQQKVEPIRERRPTYETQTNKYRIYTNGNGEVNIDVKGRTLRVPEDLARLPLIETDPDTLNEIVKQLKEVGVPITRDGNKISVGSSSSPSGLTLRVSIKKIDNKVNSVTITTDDDKYTLPDDEAKLNRYLAREPEVAYHILRIFSTHGVPVEYDSTSKTLKTKLTPLEDIIGTRTAIDTRKSVTSSSPKTINVGSNTYHLPDDWDRLKRDIQNGRVSARGVSDVLLTERIATPSDVISVITMKTSVSRIYVKRHGDDITLEIGSESFQIPRDQISLQRALKENDMPLELVRDALLRVGVDSRRVGSSIRVLTPGGDTYLTGLSTTKHYDYRIVSKPGGIEVNAGSEVYNLPADKNRLERDIADKKVLPRTLVDAFNDVGISSTMDINKQEMTVDLTSGLLRIPVPLSSGQRVGSRLRLNVRGHEGNKVYTLTVGDSGSDKIELPSEVHILNEYIRNGKVDSDLLLQLLSRMGVSHRYDSITDYNIVTLNDRKYEIGNSKKTDGGSPHSQERVF